MTATFNPVRCYVKPSINESKFIMMRHLKTVFNHESEIASKIKCKNSLIKARFDKKLVDSPITDNATEEMKRAKELQNLNIKKIYLSPMKRTILTTLESVKLLEKSKNQVEAPQIEVLPHLFEKIEDSCDLNKDLKYKISNYQTFEFRGKTYPINWKRFNMMDFQYSQLQYCDQITDENHQTRKADLHYYKMALRSLKGLNCEHEVEQNYNNKVLPIVLDYMYRLSKNNDYIESYESVAARIKKIKSIIKKDFENDENDLNDISKKVMLVGHSVIFQFWKTDHVIDGDLNKPKIVRDKLKNCELVGVDLNL